MRAGATRAGAARSGSSRAGAGPLLSRLQSSAGNQAVVQLLTGETGLVPADDLAADGNRATLDLLAGRGRRGVNPRPTAQREDEKKDPEPKADAKPETKPGAAAGAKPDAKALRQAWSDAGLVGGGQLFDLINDELSLAKLLDMGLPQLAGLAGTGAAAGFDAATEAGGSKGQVKSVGLETKEVKQVGDALAGWAEKAAEEWLHSDAGKKFVGKAQAFINKHPRAAYATIVTALAAGIAGAVAGYFMGAFDPDEFKKSFEVRGLKIDTAVDLGNFKERVLKSAKLALSGKTGPGTLAVEGTAKTVTEGKGKDARTGYDLGVTGSYSVGDEKKGGAAKGSVGYDYNTAKDQGAVTLGAGFKFKPLTLDTTWKFQGDGSGVLDTSVTGKLSDNLTLTGQTTVGAYGPASRDTPLGYKLSLTSMQGKDSDTVSMNMDSKTKDVTFGTEQVRTLWGGSLTTSSSRGVGAPDVAGAGMSYARNALKLDLKYSVDKAGKEALDVGASGKGGGVEAAFAAKFGLDSTELEKLTIHLGFTNADETLRFLQDISVDVTKGVTETKASETIKARLKQIALEVEASVSDKAGKTGVGFRADVGWKLPSGLILGAGASASLTPGKTDAAAPWMVGPNLSISYEALPIRLVGGMNLPVGPGSENMPPSFGLSIAPNWDFGGGKKKK